jgi:hypothetical protein
MVRLILHFTKGEEKKDYPVKFSLFKLKGLMKELEQFTKEGWKLVDVSGSDEFSKQFIRKQLLEKKTDERTEKI